ncbi:MAG: ABC transporter ATP-binding protein [Candidatus Marinimicrobia bacterium]|jgi:subfamily B ATP-binding cassette protein MsbA|nr:ABC transporter ATP-binding protein [Candidatus Neomarinimicrobiota bacterium]MBT3944535.1 ABC transporter ATP-binding protein [Candidatus Neomarinimicrobiota bacterium]MBT4706307.1 ABC transporter ATP-binding protein [Candidatus Neomarinimicrobiota bacterium]MBT4926228.1 ABC transporter ATP-binding protein [Candidatus Neomarinimicrobiota bacterium]MBT5251797.1 ABC transporter ATP-binding protein [Candidatus Neomarinimicrobiota bacterium]
MNQSSHIRLFKIILTYWPLLIASSIAAIIFVLFNSASIWITATMINNVLIDFNALDAENSRLLALESLSANEKLKLFSNNLLLKKTAIDTVSAVCVALIAVFTFKNIALYIKNITLSIIQFKLIRDLRNKLYEHLHYLSLSYFNKNKSGKLTSVLVSDIDNMKNSLSTSFQKLFVEPINILTFLILLFIISPKLASIAITVVPLSGVIIFGIARSIRRRAARTQEQLAGITSVIAETLGSIRIVNAFAMKAYEVKRFSSETQKYYKLMLRKDILRLVSSPVSEIVGASIAALLLWVGARDVLLAQSITSEDFIRFILLLFSLFGPMKNLSNVFNELQNGLASADRVFSILDVKSDITNAPSALHIDSLKKDIVFKDVSFHYGNKDEEVLSNINLSIKSGEIIALVGPSGGGKSTLVDLMPRFYDTIKGSISIDNNNIKDIDITSLRSLMGIVTQETFLFNDTVKANISYGVESIGYDTIKAAAVAANAHDFIEKLPDGYDTVIGERGVSLSGGQRQRVAIARALVKNPPILILDEATSSLDTESEKKVQQAIEKLMRNRTVIVIAHRLSTVHNADKIIVLDKGKIVDQGSHQELINRDGIYKQLYNMQFQT